MDRNVFEMTEKNYVISVRMFENIGKKTLLWRVLIQLWDKWPKCLSKNNRNVSAKKNTGRKPMKLGNHWLTPP